MCTNPHTYVHIVKPINIKSLITLMKHYDQKQLGEERVYLASTSQLIIERRQDWDLGARIEAELIEGCVYRFAPHGLHSLLSYRTQDHFSSRVVPLTIDWALLYRH